MIPLPFTLARPESCARLAQILPDALPAKLTTHQRRQAVELLERFARNSDGPSAEMIELVANVPSWDAHTPDAIGDRPTLIAADKLWAERLHLCVQALAKVR